MTAASFIFIVSSPEKSADFYHRLLGIAPVYVAPNFAQFNVRDDLEFDLWAITDANPAPIVGGGASEICFHVEDIQATYAHIQSLGVSVLSPPQELDFGLTTVVSDPDGHRVRFIQLLPHG